MDLTSFIQSWKGTEVVAFCGPIKYRGILEEILEGDFILLTRVAVMNPAASETSEYDKCVLNVSEISGIASEELVGRGAESPEEF